MSGGWCLNTGLIADEEQVWKAGETMVTDEEAGLTGEWKVTG